MIVVFEKTRLARCIGVVDMLPHVLTKILALSLLVTGCSVSLRWVPPLPYPSKCASKVWSRERLSSPGFWPTAPASVEQVQGDGSMDRVGWVLPWRLRIAEAGAATKVMICRIGRVDGRAGFDNLQAGVGSGCSVLAARRKLTTVLAVHGPPGDDVEKSREGLEQPREWIGGGDGPQDDRQQVPPVEREQEFWYALGLAEHSEEVMQEDKIRISARSSTDVHAKRANIALFGNVMAQGTGKIVGQYMAGVANGTPDTILGHGHSVLTMLRNQGVILDAAAFNIIINMAGRAPGGGLQATLRGLEMMDEFEVAPDVFTCNILIDSSRVRERSSTADRLGIPRLRSRSSPLKPELAEQSVKKGMKIMQLMRDRGIHPDVVSYTTIITMCSSLAEASGAVGFKKCLQLMNEMENVEGIMPNRLTFNAAIDVCAKAAGAGAPADMCLKQGLTLLSIMEDRHISPNLITLTSLVDLCARCVIAPGWVDHFEDPHFPLEQGIKIFRRIINECPSEAATRSMNMLLLTCTRLPDSYEALSRGLYVLKMVEGSILRPNIYSYNKLIELAKNVIDVNDKRGIREGIETVLWLQEKMQQSDIKPDIVTYTGLLDAFGKAGLGHKTVQKGEEILRVMKEEGVQPDVVVYNVLVNNCHRTALQLQTVQERKQCLDAAVNIIRTMYQAGTPPDCVSIAVLFYIIKSVAEKGAGTTAMEDALQIVSLFDEVGYTPTDLTAKIFIEVCAVAALHDANPSFCLREAMKMLLSVRARLPLNEGTYTCMMDCCSKAASKGCHAAVTQGMELLEMLVKEGPRPNLILCNALLDCIAKSVGARTMKDGISTGRDVLARMKIFNLMPDVISYNTMIDVCAKNVGTYGRGMRELVEILLEMRSHKDLEPDLITYNAVLNACSKAARMRNPAALGASLGILKIMESEECSVKPNVITYNAVIDACSSSLATMGNRSQCFDASYEIFQRMCASGIQPTVITCTSLIGAARLQGSQDAVEQAYKLFQSMEAGSRNHRTYVAMMGAFAGVGRREETLALLDVARSSGLKPNVFMYSSAISAVRHDPDAVRSLVAQMEVERVRMNDILLGQVQNALNWRESGRERSHDALSQ